MTAVVLDASAALAWLLTSQATEAAKAVLRRHDDFEFRAPFVFDWEVHNVLLLTARASPRAYRAMLLQLEELEIELETPTGIDHALPLAITAGLSLFDAAYLQQALDHDLALMSRDARLLQAAAARGVPVHDLR